MFVLITLGFIVLVIFIIFLGKWTWESKGDRGERYVSRILSSLNETEYKVLNDIMLLVKNGKTTQIDHIVVSCYGIFVIETKNYSGWIFGRENSEYWMQVIYQEKHKFRNPVKQNQAHIFALKELLSEYTSIEYFPIVVFVGSAELKEIDSKVPVIYDNYLLRVIQSNSVKKCLSEDEIQKIVDLLLSKNIVDEEIRAEHVQNIRKTVFERNTKMENLICPRCNGKLKLRNGKTGNFYGCSNYPRCKFTMPYKE
mgnify:CR=1 FL=1